MKNCWTLFLLFKESSAVYLLIHSFQKRLTSTQVFPEVASRCRSKAANYVLQVVFFADFKQCIVNNDGF